MTRLKSILSTSGIVLGMTLVAVLGDRVLGITLDGLLAERLEPGQPLLLLRGLEVLLVFLIFLRTGIQWPSLPSLALDCGLGFSLVFLGWTTSYLADVGLRAGGLPPFFSSLKAHEPFSATFFSLAVLVGPFLEELFFRASLYRACQPEKRFDQLWLVLISSTLFAVLHLDGTQRFEHQLPLFLMWSTCGLVTMVLYMVRGSLVPGFLLHGGANAILFFG